MVRIKIRRENENSNSDDRDFRRMGKISRRRSAPESDPEEIVDRRTQDPDGNQEFFTDEKRVTWKKRTWREDNLVRIYQLARSGLSDRRIRMSFELDEMTWQRWKREHPCIKEVIIDGHTAGTGKDGPTFFDYVHDRLPKKLLPLWDQLQACDSTEDIHAVFKKQGMFARMQLFLHAYIHHNFNISQACRTIGIAQPTFYIWLKNEPQFRELMDEMHFHKGEFFESALVRLVKKGDTAAIVFANKTFNKERGYGERVDVNVTAELIISKNVQKVDHLDLSVEDKRKLLTALRKAKEARAEGDVPKIDYRRGTMTEPVEDADYRVLDAKEKVAEHAE